VEVADCSDGGLTLRTVDRMRVDGRCAPVDAAPGERRTHVLLRSDGGTLASTARMLVVPLDAGVADGGTLRSGTDADGG